METPKIPPSEISAGGPQITFQTTAIPPPTAVYIGPDENLIVQAWNSSAGTQIRTAGRFLRPDGVITPFDKIFTPTSDRTLNNSFLRLGEGFLLGIIVGISGTAPQRGQTFARVIIAHGGEGVSIDNEYLAQGYVTTGGTVTWPQGTISSPLEGPGAIRSIVGTDPAAGAEISETVPTNARWRLIAFTSTLVNSAAVANRRLRLVHDDGANIYCNAFSTLLLPAGSTTTVTWGDSYPLVENTDQQITAPLPAQDMLRAGSRIRTITTNFQAGDNWAAPIYLVEEWIEP